MSRPRTVRKFTYPRRMVFIPSDYHAPPVLGWLRESGWTPDTPSDSKDGILVALKPCSDTPTIPPDPVEAKYPFQE